MKIPSSLRIIIKLCAFVLLVGLLGLLSCTTIYLVVSMFHGVKERTCKIEDLTGRYYAQGKAWEEYIEILPNGKYIYYYKFENRVVLDTSEYELDRDNCVFKFYDWGRAHTGGDASIASDKPKITDARSDRGSMSLFYHDCWGDSEMLTEDPDNGIPEYKKVDDEAKKPN